jgi:RNA polymerase sigma-70 factor (ECF subfamily)
VHWLKRIAVRTALESCRRRKASPVVAMEQVPDAAMEEGTSPDAAARALEEAKALLAHLPPEEQVLLTLVHLHGMSMEEAADHFGWSRAKAKIKAFRARQTLRKLLTRHGYDS